MLKHVETCWSSLRWLVDGLQVAKDQGSAPFQNSKSSVTPFLMNTTHTHCAHRSEPPPAVVTKPHKKPPAITAAWSVLMRVWLSNCGQQWIRKRSLCSNMFRYFNRLNRTFCAIHHWFWSSTEPVPNWSMLSYRHGICAHLSSGATGWRSGAIFRFLQTGATEVATLAVEKKCPRQAKEQKCSKFYHNPKLTSERCALWDDVFAVFCCLVLHDCDVVHAFALDAIFSESHRWLSVYFAWSACFALFLCPAFLMSLDCRACWT